MASASTTASLSSTATGAVASVLPPPAPTKAEALQKLIDASVNTVFKAIVMYCFAERTKTAKEVLAARLAIISASNLPAVDSKAQKIFNKIGEGLDLVLKTPQTEPFAKLGSNFINALINKIKKECVPEGTEKEMDAKTIDETGTKAAVDFLHSFVAPEAHALRAKLEADHKDLIESL
jgi:hypothetical protein